MDYTNDKRIVLTLDAGGTNFVFSAIRNGKFITEQYTLPSNSDNLEKCLEQVVKGFEYVKAQCPIEPSAISFAFPGPADYENGIIGDLPNFPSFRGGVALGPFLKEHFGVPVYIKNDGSLFAYGEAMAGALPWLNEMLGSNGCSKRYRNLLGITFGTGFGGGAVIDGKLLLGDNGVGGNIWCFRNKKYHDFIAEESVAIRAVKRVYKELSGDNRELSPKDISDIAMGKAEGDVDAAKRSFAELGEVAGDAIAMADTIIDGIVVIGGGLARSHNLIFPSLVNEMNSKLQMMNGESVGHMQVKVYNLEDEQELLEFMKDGSKRVPVYGSSFTAQYDCVKRIGVVRSKLGTSQAVSMGAYIYALQQMD